MKSLLWIADPWKNLDHRHDSTLYLASKARALFGCHSFWVTPAHLHWAKNRWTVEVLGEVDGLRLRPIESRKRFKKFSDFHSVYWRTDPPVDLSQTRLWTLLDSTLSGTVYFYNRPKALLLWNEKFSPLKIKNGQWSIPQWISNNPDFIKQTLLKNKFKKWILKPSGEAASRGVLLIDHASKKNISSTLSHHFKRFGPWLILQPYLEKVKTKGEVRVFLLNGKIVGALKKKLHSQSTFFDPDRASHSERPTLEACSLDALQAQRARFIAKELKKEGIFLATIDFIDHFVLEINVTSPGLISSYDAHVREDQKIATQFWNQIFSLEK